MAGVPLLLLMLVMFLSSLSDVTGCNFPDFLSSYGGAEDGAARRDWRTHWRQHAVHQHDDDDDDASSTSSTSAEVFFDGGLMRSDEASPVRRRQTTWSVTLDARRGHDRRHAHRRHAYQRHAHRRSPFSFTRRCEQVVDGHDGRTRYLATHRQLGESENRFICVDFVLRSSTVVQVGIRVVNIKPLCWHQFNIIMRASRKKN